MEAQMSEGRKLVYLVQPTRTPAEVNPTQINVFKQMKEE
jgi:hypothetical protein